MTCGTYEAIDFGTSGLTGTVSASDVEIPTDYNENLSADDCCTINTDDTLQVKSSCFIDRLQSSLDGDYEKQSGTTVNSRSVWKLSGAENYLWYSSDISVRLLYLEYVQVGVLLAILFLKLQAWVISGSTGSLTDAAIAQGSVGFCPNDYQASIYFYTSTVSILTYSIGKYLVTTYIEMF